MYRGQMALSSDDICNYLGQLLLVISSVFLEYRCANIGRCAVSIASGGAC